MKLLTHTSITGRLDALAGQVGGTLLLHGPAGVGKRSLALELARRLNCAGCTDNSCRSCKMIAGSNHPLVVLLSPDEKGKIGIEAVHGVQHELRYSQYEREGRRVVIISRADTATLPAQNALLKTLEEPPEGTTIILTASSPTGLLETVLSRCTDLFIPPVAADEMRAGLALAYPGRTEEVEEAVLLSQGAPGRAIGYLEDSTRLEGDQQAAGKVDGLLAADSLFERLQVADAMASSTADQELYIRLLTDQVRAAARTNASSASALDAVDGLRRRLAANVTPKNAFEALAVELS